MPPARRTGSGSLTRWHRPQSWGDGLARRVWRGSYPGPLLGPVGRGDTAGASCPTALTTPVRRVFHMSLIKVTAEELHSLSSNVATGSNSIQDQLSRMQGEVLGVVGGEWQGAASGQFHALWDEWQRSAAGLKDALDGISRLLSNAGTQYQQTEDAIRSSMGLLEDDPDPT